MNRSLARESWYDKNWLVVLLCLSIFPAGLYALWKSTKIATGWKIGVTFIIGLMLIAVIIDANKKAMPVHEMAIVTGRAVDEDIPEEVLQPRLIVEARTTSNLSVTKKPIFNTPYDFKAAFNAATAATGLGYKIGDLEVTDGKLQNTFNATLNRNLALLGSMNKETGKVVDVMMIGTGDGSVKSGTDIFLCMATLITAVDPRLSARERARILKELGIMGNREDIMDLNEKTERNGINYFLSSSETTGFLFGASRY